MEIYAQPLVALCDQKIELIIDNLPACAKVRLGASMVLPWEKSVRFESEAWFTADEQGRVDVARQKPDSGSYDFIDSMGLIVSMTSKDPDAMEKIARNISLDENLFIDIFVECGRERREIRLERKFKSDDVRRQKITTDFIAELFYTDQAHHATVIFLGGSGSGLAVNSIFAACLASHGVNVLSLPYFGENGLPSRLSAIPLEYFEKVFSWLQENPLTRDKEVRILGMSKGAELALVLASRYSFIKKMVLWAPHAYRFQGIAFKNESSWTYCGEQLPYIRLKNRWVFTHMLYCIVKNQPFTFSHVYRKGLAVAKNKPSARIEVEKCQSDILMATSDDCNMWNTYEGSLEIMEALRLNRYAHDYSLTVYENAGEPYLVPYVFPLSVSQVKLAPRLVFSMGGTLEGNARAQADAWHRAVEFICR